METPNKTSLERFKVNGNILKLTTRFDPRYQARAGMELMTILSSLAEESKGDEVVLDMSDTASMPSMMLGFLTEAQEVATKSGKKLKIRMNTEMYNRLNSLGVIGAFSEAAGNLELTNCNA